MRCAECGSIINSSAVFCPYCGAQVLGAQENEEYVYEAFISYRHSTVDREAAIRIQRFLEGAAIPKDLRTPDRGPRLGRLFRDEDELTTAGSLPDLIVDALNKSRFLIVLCSPRSRQSQWVMREVMTYAQLHGRSRILTVLVDGEPEESFPPLMQSRMERDPETGEFKKVEAEPLAADLRKSSKKEINKEITRLEAAILGCGLDDLQQRIRMRRLRINVAISLVISLVSLAVGAFALYQRSEILANLRQSQINESRILARESRDLLDEGDRFGALKTALRALPDRGTGTDRPFVPDAQFALERALGIYPRSSMWYGYLMDGAGERIDCRDSVIAQEIYGNSVAVSDLETGAPIIRVYPADGTSGGNPTSDKLSNFKLGNGTIMAAYGQTAICFEFETRKQLWHASLPGSVNTQGNILYLEEAKQFVFAAESLDKAGEYSILFCDERTGECVRSVPVTSGNKSHYPTRLAVSDDEKRIAIVVMDAKQSSSSVVVIDESTTNAMKGAPSAKLASPDVPDLAFIGDDILIASLDDWHYDNEEGYVDVDVNFEYFDSALNKKWTAVEKENVPAYATTGQLAYTVSVLGFVPESDDIDSQVVCTCGDAINYYESSSGSLLHFTDLDASIVAAAIISQDNEPLTIAGCTSEGTAFLRYPYDVDAKKDGAYDTSFAFDTLEASPIFDGGTFKGFAAWTADPQAYHIILSGNHAGGLEPTAAEDIDDDATLTYDGKNLVQVSGDTISLIDTDTFTKRWSVSAPSLGFENGEASLLAQLTKTSVLVCSASANNDSSHQLTIRELSLEDGSQLNSYQLPWEDASDTLGYVGSLAVCQSKGKRLVALYSMGECVVYDLDASDVILKVACDEGSYFVDVWLSPDSLIVRKGSDARWSVLDQYALDTGAELGESTPLASMATLSDRNLIDYANDDRSVLAIRCFDDTIRAYSTLDGSMVWESYDLVNVRFIARVSSNRLLVQESSGRCHLIDSATGKLVSSSEVKLPALSECNRLDDGHGLAVLSYMLLKPTEGESLVTFSLEEENDGFGPIGDVNYGVCISSNGGKVLVSDPWTGGYRIYERPSLAELVARANKQVNLFQGEVVDEE